MSTGARFLYQIYIADGFEDDCEELLYRCTKFDTVTYKTFCHIWKSMGMYRVFCNRDKMEVMELTEELLFIAKKYMVADTSKFEESVAALFLIYTLLNLQPYPKFASLRITPEDRPAITRLQMRARREKRIDILYILGSVLFKGQSHFHAEERDRGMELPVKKYIEGHTSIHKKGIRSKGVFFKQNEELDILKELNTITKSYSEAKKQIDGAASDRSLKYTDDNLAQDLHSSLTRLVNGIIKDKEDNTYNIKQWVKHKAMTHKTLGLKHLTGIDQRQARKKTETKPKADEDKTEIKTKNSPTPIKTYGKRKRIESGSTKTDGLPSLDNVSDTDISNTKSLVPVTYTVTEDAANIKPMTEIEVPAMVTTEEIASLPVMITTDKTDHYIVIEISGKEHNADEAGNVSTDKNTDSTAGTSNKSSDDNIDSKSIKSTKNIKEDEIEDDAVSNSKSEFKKPQDIKYSFKVEKRNQKKAFVKSKFKKQGMLPIANFEDGAEKKKP